MIRTSRTHDSRRHTITSYSIVNDPYIRRSTTYHRLQTRVGLTQARPNNSKLVSLCPKIDEDGIIRAGGRLNYADFLPCDVRYPTILPRKNWITKLIVKHHHELGKYAAGTNHTLSLLSSKYWVISAREEIIEWERECAVCRRKKAKTAQQVMAPLPLHRLLTSMRAFTRTAVYYGGPFITIQGRGRRREKRYLCLFTRLTSRAVHLEMAYGLDVDSFMNALIDVDYQRRCYQIMVKTLLLLIRIYVT